MKAEQFENISKILMKHCDETLNRKGKEYSRNDDRLHNFKRAGAMLSITAEKALLGMMVKHLVSIQDMVDDIDIDKFPDYSVLLEKFGDSINYLILLYGLISERTSNIKTVKNEAI
jgi:hypothetical protein